MRKDRLPSPLCAECGSQMAWGVTTFHYEDDGIVISVPEVEAWVCPKCGEESFTPETTDKLIETLRELLAAAQNIRRRQPAWHEYLVKV